MRDWKLKYKCINTLKSANLELTYEGLKEEIKKVMEQLKNNLELTYEGLKAFSSITPSLYIRRI